jgi:gamma-glutamyl-gamma-aminobutyrate hydrolase PuuD
MLEEAGARPLLIPPSTDGVEETLDVLDGLVISGGPDVDPALYGAEAHEATDEPRTARDAGELALLTAALERDLPVLAVCRGSQLLNVARGGDLVQHLPETLGHERHKHEPGTFSEHGVRVNADTRLGSLVGGHAPVHSHHHQGLGRLGDGLVATAWADDGSLEAIEDPSRSFALGVLWHPEAGEDAALFAALVDEARRYRERRSR